MICSCHISKLIIPKLKNNSKIIILRTVVISEVQNPGIVIYASEKDFNESNKWLRPLLKNAAKELDGQFASLAGDVVKGYDIPIIKD